MGVLPTRAVELRVAGESSQRRERDSLDELTPQELQIVQMVVQGLTNGVIAERLYLSRRTVESHLYRVFPKLGVTSRAQLASVVAHRPGIAISAFRSVLTSWPDLWADVHHESP
jgi:DNA-binding NarL/FixJ family response regulator